MRSDDVIRRLKKEGWYLDRQSGSHQQYKHTTKPARVTVAHPVADIPTKTLRSIFRQAGWNWPPN